MIVTWLLGALVGIGCGCVLMGLYAAALSVSLLYGEHEAGLWRAEYGADDDDEEDDNE